MAQVNIINRTYYLCIEDFYADTVVAEWLYYAKDTPIYLRRPKTGVERSFVLTIKDRNGADLPFIERIARITKARIEVR